MERSRETAIQGTYSVPCDHTAATDETFHAKPEFLEYHQRPDTEYGATYIMADVKKLIEMIRETDPEMIEHAKYKYRGETAQEWLEVNSEENPYNTGSFSYARTQTNRPKDNFVNALKEVFGLSSNPEPEYMKRLTMSTGNAGMLILLEEAGVSQIPIGFGADNRNDALELINKIGTGNNPVIMTQKEFPNWDIKADNTLDM